MFRILMMFCGLCLIGCEQAPQQTADPTPLATPNIKAAEKQTNEVEYKTIDWPDLIPPQQLELIENPPNYLVDLPDGLSEQELLATIEQARKENEDEIIAYEKALMSSDIIAEMDGQKIRIAGFVVPVNYDNEQKIKSFFLVPYFGACIHMPPPPPNQTIYVETETSIEVEYLYDPVWISGTLSTDLFEDEIATSAYVVQMSHHELYYD
ncbi:hypothetical protein DS2_06956 [Catenovulum agarivorans DS-2]|uniref:Lipoprotein n=1 Tax=Catenovulum agarivorans DS-2 TaxID=1328313 RepID=W7QZH7_9ALTE|nr:DUF3299 domain-containing protein [Catenovulum agarivorans]EWH10770.1 hypothetical protein DS2_06956 [Catenovulum agarivorans DS-2]